MIHSVIKKYSFHNIKNTQKNSWPLIVLLPDDEAFALKVGAIMTISGKFIK